MLKLFFFCAVLYNVGSIVMTLHYGDKGVCTDDVGNISCCFDHTLVDGKCVGCRIGFRFESGSCMPCKTNRYGSLCLRKCTCVFHQRCDHVLGCVNKTTFSQPASSQSTTCNTEIFTQTTGPNFSEESEITNPTSTKKSSEVFQNYNFTWGMVVNSVENAEYHVLGCVYKTTFSQPASSQSTTCNTEIFTQTTTPNLSEESEITNPTLTEKRSDGLLDREIVIYSVVVACIIVILGLSYLVQKYRLKTKKVPLNSTEQRVHSNQSNSLVDSTLRIYDEIDETMLHENVDINMLQHEIAINTDDTEYLYPIHVADDNKSSSVSTKSMNNSYLSIHESDQNRTSDESDRNDDTRSYLHPYHTIDEDWKEKTHQYDITHVSNKDMNVLSDSITQMIKDGYSNLYQPLNADWRQNSHSYEAPVTVHHCQLSSTVSSELDVELKEKGNDYNQITTCKHNKIAYINEACNKQEIGDYIPWNNELTEMSAKLGNNVEISTELTNLNNVSTNDPSSIQREKALVSVIESDIKNFEDIEDKLQNYNVLKNDTMHTKASFHTDQNTNVHDYTDAKSQ